MIEVGETIRTLRKKRGWSAQTLADKAGISAQTVYYIEKGEGKSPTLTTLTSVAQALDKKLVVTIV